MVKNPNTTIALINFNADTDTEATIGVTYNEVLAGHVKIKMTEGPNNDQHVIEYELIGLPHYAQAKIIYEASLMLDSLFEDCETPYDSKSFDA